MNQWTTSWPVRCVETGECFDSMTQASKAYGMNVCVIKRRVETGLPVHGRHFVLNGKIRKRPIRDKILCVETGDVCNSMAEAERETGIKAVGIYHSVINYKGQKKTAGGYHWKRVNGNA